MPKTKWEGAEDPTINNFFKIESRKFEVDRNNPWRQVSSGTKW